MGSIAAARFADDEHSRLQSLIEVQRAAHGRDLNASRATRIDRLARLDALLRENTRAIAAALSEDFGNRSAHETRLLEIFPCLEGIKYARRHLAKWMGDERRRVSLWFQPGRARVMRQPLGVVGIVAPWNYPVLLTVSPLTAALAAGNRAMVKVSELSPRSSALFAALVGKYFSADEVAVVEGDATLAEVFAGLPFDHLLFTGSTRVGAAVMRSAAANLTPITLELGGKSPAIIGSGADLDHAADRILAGKCLNAGQSCIAPDYVLLPAGREAEFVAAARRVVDAGYPEMVRTPDYSSIVNARHFDRLVHLLDEARARGATAVSLSSSLSEPDSGTRRFPPIAVLGAAEDTALMRDEIFGPLLPLVGYRDLDQAIRYVNDRPRPLSLYYFDRDAARIDRVLRQTVAGGVTVNDTMLHIAQHDLPFGGVGPSGMGRYHGREGFESFSVSKSVFVQSRINALGLLKPPYARRVEAMLKLLLA